MSLAFRSKEAHTNTLSFQRIKLLIIAFLLAQVFFYSFSLKISLSYSLRNTSYWILRILKLCINNILKKLLENALVEYAERQISGIQLFSVTWTLDWNKLEYTRRRLSVFQMSTIFSFNTKKMNTRLPYSRSHCLLSLSLKVF